MKNSFQTILKGKHAAEVVDLRKQLIQDGWGSHTKCSFTDFISCPWHDDG